MAERIRQKISPFLWFDSQAEEAVSFYVSIFESSRVKSLTRYGTIGPGPEGTVMTIAFELAGQEFVALNGGPLFKFNESISFVVYCDTQAEIDDFWSKLSAGGTPGQCGWLKDKFGLSWQVFPVILIDMMQDPEKAQSVMKAVLQMNKLDIAGIQRAYQQNDASR